VDLLPFCFDANGDRWISFTQILSTGLQDKTGKDNFCGADGA
jgi:hypothetical protein